MFRKMRLIRQQLSKEETETILREGTSGVLALVEDNSYPYAVPVNYLYEKNRIYFHGARNGQKIEMIRKNAKASFCVIGMEKIVPKKYTTFYQSAIAFGQIRIIEDESEKREAIEHLAAKFCSNDKEGIREEIARGWNALSMFVLEVEHMTGKQAIELVEEVAT